jgi:hypothetical protein
MAATVSIKRAVRPTGRGLGVFRNASSFLRVGGGHDLQAFAHWLTASADGTATNRIGSPDLSRRSGCSESHRVFAAICRSPQDHVSELESLIGRDASGIDAR